MSEVLKIVDWRQPKYDKVCPECLSALVQETVTSEKGRIAFAECVNQECRRREMVYEKPGEKAREY